jgi:hypothetical protein
VTNADLTDTSLVGFEAPHVLAPVKRRRRAARSSLILLEVVDLLEWVGIARGDSISDAVESAAREHASLRAEARRRSVLEIEDPIGMPTSSPTRHRPERPEVAAQPLVSGCRERPPATPTGC